MEGLRTSGGPRTESLYMDAQEEARDWWACVRDNPYRRRETHEAAYTIAENHIPEDEDSLMELVLEDENLLQTEAPDWMLRKNTPLGVIHDNCVEKLAAHLIAYIEQIQQEEWRWKD